MKLNRDMFRDDDDALFAPIGAHPADHVPDQPAEQSEPDQRVPINLIDKYFDGELRPDETRSFFEKLRRRPDRARETARTQRAIDALKKPVSSPDFTANIIRAVGNRRAWLPHRDRVAVWALRYAAVFILVGMTAAAFTFQRVAPEATNLANQPTPVANVVDAVSESTEIAASNIPGSIANFQSSVLFDQSQFSLASFPYAAHTNQRFVVADNAIEPAAPSTFVSACGLSYSDHQTTLSECTPATPDKNTNRRAVVITISTKK